MLIATLLIVLFVGMVPMKTQATGSLLNQINQAEKEKEAAEKEKQQSEGERDDKKNQIQNLQFQQGSLKTQLESFNNELAEANNELQIIQGKIADKKDEIAQKEIELEEARDNEATQYANMKKRVQKMYEQPQNMYLDMLLSSRDFATFLNVADYIIMMSEYDKNMMEDHKQATIAVENAKVELENQLAELDELEDQNKAEQDRITDLINTTNTYVQQYGAQIANANSELADIEKEIADKEAEIAAQEANIEELKKKYEEELRLSQLAAQSAKRDISEVTFQDNDRYLLANLIYCEAGGEPYEGQLAVGAVVMNRVMSSCYPDSIYDVIYQRSQFSPAGSGRLALALAENRATASCYQAADQAMAGMSNVGNRVYFRTPIPGLEGMQIGNHIFY